MFSNSWAVTCSTTQTHPSVHSTEISFSAPFSHVLTQQLCFSSLYTFCVRGCVLLSGQETKILAIYSFFPFIAPLFRVILCPQCLFVKGANKCSILISDSLWKIASNHKFDSNILEVKINLSVFNAKFRTALKKTFYKTWAFHFLREIKRIQYFFYFVTRKLHRNNDKACFGGNNDCLIEENAKTLTTVQIQLPKILPHLRQYSTAWTLLQMLESHSFIT